MLFRLQRALFPAGAPRLVILGKGYSDGAKYSQHHFDNSSPSKSDSSPTTCGFSAFTLQTTNEREWIALDAAVLDWPPSPDDLKPWVIPDDERAARKYEGEVYGGREPTFDQVASFYPPIKYPNAIVGADGYPGKVFIAWNGDLVLPAVAESFAGKIGKGSYVRLGFDEPGTSLDDRGVVRRSLRKGYLPVVTTQWEKAGIAYGERVFAARLRDNVMVVFMNLSLKNNGGETRTARFHITVGEMTPTTDPKAASRPWRPYPCPLRMKEGGVLVERRGDTDRVVAAFEPVGAWRAGSPVAEDGASSKDAAGADNAMGYSLEIPPGQTRRLCLRLPFYPMPVQHEQEMLAMQEDSLLAECEAGWERFLQTGNPFRLPEKVIADAVKTHLINNQIITNEIDGHRIPSYGAYTYEGVIYDPETEEFLEAMDLYGNHEETRRMIEYLLDRGEKAKLRPSGEYDQPEGWLGFGMVNFYGFGAAGSRAICEHYRLTGDTEWLRAMEPRLLRAAEWIRKARATTMHPDPAGRKMSYYGLIPRGEWCDIGEWEHWYFNSAAFYLSLRDIADVLHVIDKKKADAIDAEDRAFREDILRSVDSSTDHKSDPPLIPMAPCVRTPHAAQQNLQANTYGMYWSIVGPSILMHYGVIDPTDQRATWILDCLERRNGFLLGNARFGVGIDAKYGYPSVMTYLRRGEITKVLLHLYGFRAYGMSRDTCSTPEGYMEVKTGGVQPQWWIPCLPDRFANSRYLMLVRNLMVREDAGTLYLLDATPRQWLEDGKSVEITSAPSYFGPVTLKVTSRAGQGEIHCELRLPENAPCDQVFLRLRHPTSATLKSVTIDGKPWSDFDAKRERIRLPKSASKVVLVARYQ